jgi:DNA-binding NtrC family response regulator
VSTDPVADAVRRLADRYDIVRARDAREAVRLLARPLALLLGRCDPACVEPRSIVLAARAARTQHPEAMVVVFAPRGVAIPTALIRAADCALWSSSLPALLPDLMRLGPGLTRAASVSTHTGSPPALESRVAVRRRRAEEALAFCDGNVSAAARHLGITPATLRKWHRG